MYEWNELITFTYRINSIVSISTIKYLHRIEHYYHDSSTCNVVEKCPSIEIEIHRNSSTSRDFPSSFIIHYMCSVCTFCRTVQKLMRMSFSFRNSLFSQSDIPKCNMHATHPIRQLNSRFQLYCRDADERCLFSCS